MPVELDRRGGTDRGLLVEGSGAETHYLGETADARS